MLPEFGGDTRTQTDVYMTGRTNGVATYRNNGFFGQVDGLNFALQYQGNNENPGSGEGTGNGGDRKLARENGDGFGMSASYDFDFGLSTGLLTLLPIVPIIRFVAVMAIAVRLTNMLAAKRLKPDRWREIRC